MAYNVAVVVPPIPQGDGEAWKLINETELLDEAGPRPEIFHLLHDRLTAQFPCPSSLPPDQVANGAWCDGPLINNFLHKAALLGISDSRVDEVLPFLIVTSNDLGLVVFDWAIGMIHRP